MRDITWEICKVELRSHGDIILAGNVQSDPEAGTEEQIPDRGGTQGAGRTATRPSAQGKRSRPAASASRALEDHNDESVISTDPCRKKRNRRRNLDPKGGKRRKRSKGSGNEESSEDSNSPPSKSQRGRQATDRLSSEQLRTATGRQHGHQPSSAEPGADQPDPPDDWFVLESAPDDVQDCWLRPSQQLPGMDQAKIARVVRRMFDAYGAEWSWNSAPPITDYIDLNGDARPGDAMDGLTRKECVNEWAVFLSRIESSEKYTALWGLFVDLSTQLTRFGKLVPPPTWPTDLIAAEYYEEYRAEVFSGAGTLLLGLRKIMKAGRRDRWPFSHTRLSRSV